MILWGPQSDSAIRHMFIHLVRGLVGVLARRPGHYFGLEPRGAR
jgi:hypothetical protein